jgi:hypothetical protein
MILVRSYRALIDRLRRYSTLSAHSSFPSRPDLVHLLHLHGQYHTIYFERHPNSYPNTYFFLCKSTSRLIYIPTERCNVLFHNLSSVDCLFVSDRFLFKTNVPP